MNTALIIIGWLLSAASYCVTSTLSDTSGWYILLLDLHSVSTDLSDHILLGDFLWRRLVALSIHKRVAFSPTHNIAILLASVVGQIWRYESTVTSNSISRTYNFVHFNRTCIWAWFCTSRHKLWVLLVKCCLTVTIFTRQHIEWTLITLKGLLTLGYLDILDLKWLRWIFDRVTMTYHITSILA